MRAAILGFVLGVALLQMQASLPTLPLLGFALLLALAAGIRCRALKAVPRLAALFACGALAGFCWAGLYASLYLSQQLPREWEGRDITLVGTVDNLPYSFGRGVRFDFAVEQVLAPAAAAAVVPRHLALSWYAESDAERSQSVRPGERWRLTVRLHRPHGNANPFGFDYEVWLLERDLRAVGYVRPDRHSALKNQRLDAFVPGFGNLVQRGRAWLRQRIEAALPGREYAGVITALVIGDQRAIGQSDWKVFNRTGISHLISISGLHITMVAGMFAWLAGALWRRSFFTRAQLPLLLPAPKAAALAGAITALLYVLLAGFGVPAQRTLYMLSVVAAALWAGRIASVSHVLCAALGAVVLLDPWAVLWPGFWLSFCAVAVILYASGGRLPQRLPPQAGALARARLALRSAAHLQYVVTLGLVPLTLLLFARISLVSPIANAVAIPLVGLVVTPLSLLGAVAPGPFAGWLLGSAHFLIAELAGFLYWLSGLPLAVWAAPTPSWWMFAGALAGTLWMLAPPGWPVRWLGLAGLLPMLVSVPAHPAAGTMWVTAFDVGQGMALLVETPHHRLLYDAGPAYSADSDAGERVLVPYLQARGIARLDALVISHSDTDHSGGALSVLDRIAVKRLWSSLSERHPVMRAAVRHARCEAGQEWSWDGVHFEMLQPSAGSYDDRGLKSNARSCTLKVTLGSRSILLPGDIEAPQERELLARASDSLPATVLLAPHHGSGTSSTAPFLEAVRPEIALFQVGYRNRYHHPKAEVYQRYGDLGIRRLRSDRDGAVLLRFAGKLEVRAYRRSHARYWYGR